MTGVVWQKHFESLQVVALHQQVARLRVTHRQSSRQFKLAKENLHVLFDDGGFADPFY